PDQRSSIAVTLTLRARSGGAGNEYVGMTTDARGYFTAPVGTLSQGDYDWRIKDPKYLATSGSVTLAGAPVTSVEMGTQLGADATNDNVVNVTDFTTLKSTFG